MTAVGWQLVMDARDPHALADFWAVALGAEVEDNEELIEKILAAGHAQPADTVCGTAAG